MICSFCNGEMRQWVSMPIDAKKNAPTPYSEFLRCAKCGTGAMHPLPPVGAIAELYELPAYYTQSESHIKDRPPTVLDRILIKLAWMRDNATPFDAASDSAPGQTVLDLGCGDGALLAEFHKAGCIVLGVDPDPKARTQAAARGVEVLEGTAESLPPELSGRMFDLVVMTHALEHCTDPNKALSNARGLIAPGGRLYIEVPNCGCVHFETMTICSENFDSPRHLFFFTAAGLEAAIEKAGMGVQDWRFHGFTRHHLPGWRDWESRIAEQLRERGIRDKVKPHTFFRSLAMLARSAFAPDARKYDAIGAVARKPSGERSTHRR